MGQYRDRSTESTRDEPKIVFGESKSVDYELEFAAIIGKPLARNKRLRATHADEHIFGFVILNDWSGKSPFCELQILCSLIKSTSYSSRHTRFRNDTAGAS
jgi:hypothetical protein